MEVFARPASLTEEGVNHQSMIKEWWSRGDSQRLQQVYNGIPALICWELWKRRNNGRHGGGIAHSAMIHNILANIHYLIRTLYPNMKIMHLAWDV